MESVTCRYLIYNLRLESGTPSSMPPPLDPKAPQGTCEPGSSVRQAVYKENTQMQ
jgi:hypothetical protein